jgi:hypothetical protein
VLKTSINISIAQHSTKKKKKKKGIGWVGCPSPSLPWCVYIYVSTNQRAEPKPNRWRPTAELVEMSGNVSREFQLGSDFCV